MKSSKLASCLLAILAAAGVVVTKSWPAYRSFQTGGPVFAAQTVSAAAGSSLGNVALQRGVHYLIRFQDDSSAPFDIFFRYRDQSMSKVLLVSHRFTGHTYESVIKADRNEAAAQVIVARESGAGAQAIDFHDLRIFRFDPWFYVWRRGGHIGSTLLLLAAAGSLFWSFRRRKDAGPALPSPSPAADPLKPTWWKAFWSVRRAGGWALCFLIVGVCCDGFFLDDQHSHLFQKPFQSSIVGWDPSFYYFWLRSVMVDGDVDFRNDLLYCDTMTLESRQYVVDHGPRTKTGLIPDKYPIGWALLELPWYVAGDLTAQLMNACGGHVLYDGWGPVYQAFLMLGQIVYATASLYFAWKILEEFLPPAAALGGLMLGWLGSSLFYYQTLNFGMSHNVMFFAMTGAYYFSYRLQENPRQLRNWLLVGLLSAFVILARNQGAIMLLFPGVVCLQEVVKDFRRLSGLLVATVAGAIPLSLQMVAWKYMFGSYFLYTYQGETFSWRHPHLYEVLFSPFHGLFNWHPLMLVGCLGFLAWAVRGHRYTEAICFTISLALALYINAAWDAWWFGASFGSRAFETCTLFFMLGLGFILQALVPLRISFHAAAAVLLLLVLWNMNLMTLVQFGHLALERPLTWKERWDTSVNYWPHAFD